MEASLSHINHPFPDERHSGGRVSDCKPLLNVWIPCRISGQLHHVEVIMIFQEELEEAKTLQIAVGSAQNASLNSREFRSYLENAVTETQMGVDRKSVV